MVRLNAKLTRQCRATATRLARRSGERRRRARMPASWNGRRTLYTDAADARSVERRPTGPPRSANRHPQPAAATRTKTRETEQRRHASAGTWDLSAPTNAELSGRRRFYGACPLERRVRRGPRVLRRHTDTADVRARCAREPREKTRRYARCAAGARNPDAVCNGTRRTKKASMDAGFVERPTHAAQRCT